MGRFTCSMTQALLMALTIQMNHKATLRKFVHSCLADLQMSAAKELQQMADSKNNMKYTEII